MFRRTIERGTREDKFTNFVNNSITLFDGEIGFSKGNTDEPEFPPNDRSNGT